MDETALTHAEVLEISAVQPFNFDISARIFANGDQKIRIYENGKFHQVIRIHDKVAFCSVESVGTVENPKLTIEIQTGDKLTAACREKAATIVSALFNLDFDLGPFYEDIKTDNVMASITKKLFGLKSPTTQFAFEALTDSIVEQQISLKVAHALEVRLIKKWGDTVNVDGEVFYAYPTPKTLAVASPQELRDIGLSQRKAEYIKNAASLIAEGNLNLETLKTYPDPDDIIKELDEIRGIGVWTAELTMLRGMQRLEALPADDLGLRRTISHFYCIEKVINSSQAREIAENWAAWDLPDANGPVLIP